MNGRAVLKSVSSALLGVAATAVVLECALQVASGVVWLKGRRTADRPVAGGKAILTIGDSFTYGLGASSPGNSWPARLEALLHESGRADWRVINGALSGRDSREALLSLPTQLLEAKPAVVYVMLGNNDFWNQPRLVTADELAGASTAPDFRWRWRTVRLFRIASQRSVSLFGSVKNSRVDRPPQRRLNAGSSTQHALDVTGTWRFEARILVIEPGGRLLIGADTMHWALEGDTLVMTAPGQSSGIGRRFHWSRERDRLMLSNAVYPNGLALFAAPRDDSLLAHASAAEAHARAGQLDQSQREIAWLKREYQRRGEPDSMVLTLLYVAQSVDHLNDVLGTARALAARHATNAWVWHTIATVLFDRRDRAGAIVAIDKAVRFAPDSTALGVFLRDRARFVEDPEESLRDLLQSWLVDHNDGLFGSSLQRSAPLYSNMRLEAALTTLGVAEPQRIRIRVMHRRAVDPDRASVLRVLEVHFREIVRLVSAAGARAVFVSYPFRSEQIEALARRVAAETGSGWVDVHSAIDARLLTVARESLFVPDGHLNDAGYSLVASTVLPDALRQLESGAR